MIITSRYKFVHHPIESLDRGIGQLRFSARFRRTLESIIQDSKDSPDFYYQYSAEDETIAVVNIYGYCIYFYKNKETEDVSIRFIS